MPAGPRASTARAREGLRGLRGLRALWTWTRLYGLVLGRAPTNAMRCTQAPSPHRAQPGPQCHWPDCVRVSAVPMLKIVGCFELHPHLHGILLCLPESNPLAV